MIGPAEDRPETPRASDTRARLIATPIILLVIGGVLAIQEFTGSAIGTNLVLAAFAAMAGAEMALLFRRGGQQADPVQAAVGCGALCAIGLVDDWRFMVLRVVVLVGVLVWILLANLRDTRPSAAVEMAFTFVPVLYIGFLISFMVEFTHDWRALIWVILTAKCSDMAGWAVGKPFGKHKMIPSVSPGKSWEGTIAGLAASALAAPLLSLALWGHTDWTGLPLFGFALGAASILAGITWSGWKRRMDAKDSSGLIPHMGGIVDMVDSLLFAGPVAWAWMNLGYSAF